MHACLLEPALPLEHHGKVSAEADALQLDLAAVRQQHPHGWNRIGIPGGPGGSGCVQVGQRSEQHLTVGPGLVPEYNPEGVPAVSHVILHILKTRGEKRNQSANLSLLGRAGKYVKKGTHIHPRKDHSEV